MKIREKLLGKKFGRWTVIGETLTAQGTPWPKWKLQCICSCGKEQSITRGNLLLGLTKGCHKCGLKSKANGESAKTQVWNIYIGNARTRNREFSLTKEQFFELTQKPCHYCKMEPHRTIVKPYDSFTYNGIDRKDNKEGYTVGNSLPCCAECNLSKGVKSYEEFVAWLDRFGEIPSSHVTAVCLKTQET